MIQQEEQTLTARALGGLTKIPGIRVYGIKDPDSPRFARKGGVIVFEVKEVLAAPQVAKELAERGGTGVRAGCHCAHLGLQNREGDVDVLIDMLDIIARQPRTGMSSSFRSRATGVQKQMDSYARTRVAKSLRTT